MEAVQNQEDQVSVGQQYLTFILAGEEYAMDILKVQEIRGYEDTTAIPNTPDYLMGVINLRGSVVPIVDLRVRFGLVDEAGQDNQVIVLVRLSMASGERVVGIVVDAVSDVYTIDLDDIGDTPDLASSAVRQFVTGLATIAGKMIIMLDIDSLISSGVLEEEVITESLGEVA